MGTRPDHRRPDLRQQGARLDDDKFTHELARRALTATRFAEIAGISPVVLSRVRHGQRMTFSTLRKIAQAMNDIPIVPGADLILSPTASRRDDGAGPREKKTAGSATAPAVTQPTGMSGDAARPV